MKKIVLMAVAMLMLAVPAVNAQKINVSSEQAKLAKADAACEDAKKGIKAATWLARGKAYADAYALPTKELGRGIPEAVLAMNVGRPMNAVEGEFAGMPVVVYEYEWFDAYLNPQTGTIEGWKQKKSIADNLAEVAYESYKKALELDPKVEAKVVAGAMNLANSLVEQAESLFNLGESVASAEAFELAYRAQKIAPSATADVNNLYNAGIQMTMYASTQQGEAATAAFAKGEKLFTEALQDKFNDPDGNIYYYLFHCYYGQKELDREVYLQKAKESLLTGIKLFPKNNTILDGLMQFYTAEEGVGDPAELTQMIENSLKDNPDNYDLWFGRGRVYNAMKNYDECIKSFEKCVELRPNEYEPNFYVGYFIIEKANAQIETLNATPNMSYQLYEEENAKINMVYAEAIPWLEKAFEINPQDTVTVEFLNMLCFRLRDMEGMMDKYNKYHELYVNMR